MEKQLSKIQQNLRLTFKNTDLLRLALTHSSYAKKILKTPFSDNERLEYLGDAVLKLIVSMHLYNTFPTYDEGKLTKLRSKMIGDQFLATIAHHINLGKYMRFSYGEKNNGGDKRSSNLANAFEALLGAIYLDQGFDACSTFFLYHLQKHNDALKETVDYKSKLQEQLQKTKSAPPIYTVEKESGPDHKKNFDIRAKITFNNDTFDVQTNGATKKEAEQLAAQKLLEKIQKNSP